MAGHAGAGRSIDVADRALQGRIPELCAAGRGTWRGQKDQAFQWLDRAYHQHDGGLIEVKVDPVLGSLRTDPRYHAFLVKMKLAQQRAAT